ncbi:MAG: hypothetical protein JSV49_11015 [Thermoplasmata archaeon]|nr:MAG: hypothetical protein JSV49_11015 [Thermoplasmata archaeon]
MKERKKNKLLKVSLALGISAILLLVGTVLGGPVYPTPVTREYNSNASTAIDQFNQYIIQGEDWFNAWGLPTTPYDVNFPPGSPGGLSPFHGGWAVYLPYNSYVTYRIPSTTMDFKTGAYHILVLMSISNPPITSVDISFWIDGRPFFIGTITPPNIIYTQDDWLFYADLGYGDFLPEFEEYEPPYPRGWHQIMLGNTATGTVADVNVDQIVLTTAA